MALAKPYQLVSPAQARLPTPPWRAKRSFRSARSGSTMSERASAIARARASLPATSPRWRSDLIGDDAQLFTLAGKVRDGTKILEQIETLIFDLHSSVQQLEADI